MTKIETRSTIISGRIKKRKPSDNASDEIDNSHARIPCVVPPIGVEQRVVEHKERVIDLLNPQPAVIVNTRQLKRALSFGFAGGDTVGVIRSALHNAPLEETEWDPTCFEGGLFLTDLFSTSMQVAIPNLKPKIDTIFLTQLLTHPPKDQRVVDYRKEILAELVSDSDLRDRFEKTYRSLYNLRELFESESRFYDPDGRQRRLETLAAIKKTIEDMGDGYKACKSGLSRLHRFASYATETEGFERLEALLDFDNHLAAVDLKLRIGADGNIRRFEISKMEENKENPFHQSPLRRFFTRVRMVFRGYIFSEGELVNRWVDSVFEGIETLLPPMIQTIGEMEFYLASLAFRDTATSKGLEVCFPKMYTPITDDQEASAGHEVKGLFNPLLFGQAITPVPCDLKTEKWETITVVTGPNSGGKTRLLQAVAIAQMFAQSGMFVPAAKASFCRAPGLFVSLIEEARADQREGRLGTELIRIRNLFEKSKPGSLVVLDELCSGTNPSEGEEIFRLVISLLNELGPCVFITTHFLQFAARLSRETNQEANLQFLKVELDDKECPTFRFNPGVADTSLAHQTAARLGVTREELLMLVRRNRRMISD
jgi:DNA mismatch repair protein MutS2